MSSGNGIREYGIRRKCLNHWGKNKGRQNRIPNAVWDTWDTCQQGIPRIHHGDVLMTIDAVQFLTTLFTQDRPETATSHPEPWNTATARALVDAVLQERGLKTFPWHSAAGREDFLRLIRLEEAIDDAFLSEDMTALRQAVVQWRASYVI